MKKRSSDFDVGLIALLSVVLFVQSAALTMLLSQTLPERSVVEPVGSHVVSSVHVRCDRLELLFVENRRVRFAVSSERCWKSKLKRTVILSAD